MLHIKVDIKTENAGKSCLFLMFCFVKFYSPVFLNCHTQNEILIFIQNFHSKIPLDLVKLVIEIIKKPLKPLKPFLRTNTIFLKQ